MILKFRGQDYEFTPDIIRGGKDNPNGRNRDIDAHIFGLDTEQVFIDGVYESQCYQLSTPWFDDLYWMPNRSIPLFLYLELLTDVYYEYDLQSNPIIITYIHNLGYDLVQMVKFDPVLYAMARVGFSPDEPTVIHHYDGWEFTLEGHAIMKGTAPHMTVICRRGLEVFTVKFRDSFSYFQGPLSKVLQQLNVGVEKMERQSDLGLVDYRLPENDGPRKLEFEQYSIIDAIGVRKAGETIRELHKAAGMQKIRVSSPGFAINSLFHGMSPKQFMLTGVKDESIMQLILDTYHGGRTGGRYHGRVYSAKVYDFHSSYPASMTSLPSFGKHTKYDRIKDTSDTAAMIQLIKDFPTSFLVIDGEETDDEYPALITSIKGKLTPVYGKFEKMPTTGVEAYAGYASGTLKIHKVHELVIVTDMEECEKPWRTFSLKKYEEKASNEKGSIAYIASKLGLNAPYGKTIETIKPTLTGLMDAECIFPLDFDQEELFTQFYYEKYLESQALGVAFEDMYDSILTTIYDSFDELKLGEPLPDGWGEMLFSQMSPGVKKFGRYAIPAAASLITGISRARLRALIKCTDAVYWDTDSAVIEGKTHEEINACLEIGSSWLPHGIIPLKVGEALGELDCEIENARGFLAGTKRYFLQQYNEDGTPTLDKKGKPIIKKATHGMAGVPYDVVESAIKHLATGSDFIYKSKPKPLRIKEAKTVELVGSFESKEYAPNFNLDDRQEWVENDHGYCGRVRPLSSMLTNDNHLVYAITS